MDTESEIDLTITDIIESNNPDTIMDSEIDIKYNNNDNNTDNEMDAPMFFQTFSFSSIIICIDYNPRKINFTSLKNGDYSQLIHMFPLNQVEISLKSYKKNGIKNMDDLLLNLVKHWAIDFSKHQTHKYIAGIQPIRSIVNIGHGFMDLVIIPIKQYKKRY